MKRNKIGVESPNTATTFVTQLNTATKSVSTDISTTNTTHNSFYIFMHIRVESKESLKTENITFKKQATLN